nr:MAG TPA: hypothetical protein [Caudoviricetes sp.]
MDDKCKLGKLLAFYKCELEDIHEELENIIFDTKRKEYNYIKNDNIRNYRIRRYFLNQIEGIDTSILRDDTIRRDCKNIDSLLYYYFFTMLNNKYCGDESYNRIKYYLYGKYGI